MSMSKMFTFFLMFGIFSCLVLFSSGLLIKDAYSHGLFNSAGQRIGKYYMQIATEPEIPTTGQYSKILLRVSSDEVELSDVPITITITKNGQELNKLPPIVITNGHYEFNYKFLEPGNYVFYIDLQDLYFSGETLTYAFNISTLNPFGYIFFSLISFASVTPFAIISVIYFKNRKDRKRRIAENQN